METIPVIKNSKESNQRKSKLNFKNAFLRYSREFTHFQFEEMVEIVVDKDVAMKILTRQQGH